MTKITRQRGRRRKLVRTMPHAQDPDSLGSWVLRFLEHLRVRGYSEWTIDNRERYGRHFSNWCDERSIVYPQEVTKPLLEAYQRSLFHFRTERGEPLGFTTQAAHLITVRQFFKWLMRQNVLLYNPASELELPRQPVHLPAAVMSVEEAERVLSVPDVREVLGLRDRAILEVLYATGVRRAEVIKLGLFDVDSSRRVLMVREGKGKKDRVVPLGERALAWVNKYLADARPLLVLGTDEQVLFLTQDGAAFTPDGLTELVGRYVREAGISKKGSCHIFRHTMATLMLEGGADIRFVQAMLGHVNLDTTAIYTRVSITKLQEVHALTHPGARLGSTTQPVLSVEDDDEEPASADNLLSRLAAEDEDELEALDEGEHEERSEEER
jgi:integrase/recombinase XerD